MGLQTLDQQLQRCSGKRMHVVETVRLAGAQRTHTLERTGHGETTVAGRIALAIARRPRRAGLTQPPDGREALLRYAGAHLGMMFGGGAHAA